MTDLAVGLRVLAGYDRRSPALLVQMPSGGYRVSADGFGGRGSVYVISRAQLREVMLAEGLHRDDLVDMDDAERLARAVDVFRQRRTRVV